jgi:prevent-host-death family protein
VPFVTISAIRVRAPEEYFWAMNSNQKGTIAEAAIALHAIKLGIPVLKPVAEHERYDLAFELGSGIIRVQCKSAVRKGEVVYVHLAGYRLTTGGRVRSTYAEDEIDAVAAYCIELDSVYLLPSSLVAGRTALQLRLAPPKNGQRAALNWASQYELPGAVAQLGERVSGTHEVTGSSPVSSTPQGSKTAPMDGATVGAHIFRNHFGYYMERAAAGEEILVTRRGRPTVRLVPAQPQPSLGDTGG